ncbi:HD domain-containing protein [bacterium]|nr:HD domain-containing protein [bacterium]
MSTVKNVPASTAGLLRKALADDMKESLRRYHQVDGLKNGSQTDGVQFNPLCKADEKSLKKHMDDVTKYLSQQKNIDFRPSPNFEPHRGEFRTDMAKRSAKYVESSAKLLLEQATNLIMDPSLKALVKTALKSIPKEFYSEPSSSTGKYHPADEINKGGLVLHTCRVVAMAQHLGDFYEISQKERDILTAGLILHDSCKGGEPWEVYAKDHGDVAAAHIAKTRGGNSADGKLVQQVAANHMAQWSQTADGKRTPRPPDNKLDQIVSYADYLAAQDNVYVIPEGYKADYLKDTPVDVENSGPVAEHLKWFTSGNKVTPLADAAVTPKDKSDDIFVQVKQGIREAKKSIQLEMFGLGQKDIAQLLIDRKKEGLDVQVVLDPVNDSYEQEKQECIDMLKEGGVEVLIYPTREKDETNKYDQINHVKMLLLDGDKAIIGGMNWGGHSPVNHDVDVMIEGPIVDKMEALFNKDYAKSGGNNPLPIEKTSAHPEGESLVSLATGSDDPKERQIKAALHRAIRDAKESVHCELFFLTDWSILKALTDAKARGVDVKVLLNPSQIGDTKHNERAYDQLTKAGCDVKWFSPNEETGSKLHAKIGIFDGQEVILGSANWSGTGLTWNREANVDVVDKSVAGYYEKMFKADFKKGVDEPNYIENKHGAT